MYINAVLSYLNGWKKLQGQHLDQEIRSLIINLNEDNFSQLSSAHFGPSIRYYSAKNLVKQLKFDATALGWQTRQKLYPGKRGKRYYTEIGAFKNRIAVDFIFHAGAYVESDLFIKFPVLFRDRKIEVGAVLVPMTSVAETMGSTIVSFEVIRQRIAELAPLSLKYPFVVIGLSGGKGKRSSKIDLWELTSELDQFLFDETGMALDEMRVNGEAANYDFKETPPESKKMAQEVCAFANFKGGGLILLGIDNAGNVKGILRSELDRIQLSITSAVTDICLPPPKIDFNVFDVPEQGDRCILVVKVNEIARKPCMVNNRVYVRMGASARPAGPDKVRQLVLGSD